MRIRIFAAGAALALAAGPGPALGADGAEVYAHHCASCHGRTGEADTPAGKLLKAPALAGDARLASLPAPELQAAIRARPKHASVLQGLGDDDLAAAAAYAAQLAGKRR